MTLGQDDLGRKPIAQINVSNLKSGVHRYAFECETRQFGDESLDETRFSAPIHVAVTLTKTVGEIVAELSVRTVVSLECDRCLAPIRKTIQGDYRIVFLRSATTLPDDDGDDVRLLAKNETRIDLTEDVRETLLLAVPMKNVCGSACAENDAPIASEFRQASSSPVASEWQRQLAEIGKKFRF
ncbi:MAG: DUF177 domain-containing protein [Chloroherpetonaceae bacterium]|nr:DUF177 domain-containing protein [Chloroherpetonaceae bacterium]MDW8437363.1 DUF177 domain-containing protein [Chloroherpetonaceae bacterium]